MKAAYGLIFFAVYAVGCTSNSGNGGQQPATSSLTAIDVALPAKDKLPAGLDPEKLY
jgi:hypothetical protein